MGGFIAPSTTIGGTVAAPGIPLTSSPLSGLYQYGNGFGFAVSGMTTATLNALGATYGQKPSVGYAVTPLTGSPFGATLTSSIVVHPIVAYAYAANNTTNSGQVFIYAVNPSTGALTLSNTFTMAVGDTLKCLIVSPDGNFLYGISSAVIYVSSINQSTGALTNQFNYASTGTLSPRSASITPNGNYLIAANGAGSVKVFSRNLTTGALTAITGSPFNTGGANSFSVAVSPDGNYALVADQAGNAVYTFSIASSGALTAVVGSPFACGTTPYSISVSPDGLSAFTSNRGSNNITVFSLASGILSPISTSPVAVGNTPLDVMTSPDSNHVSVLNDTTISVFSRNATTGALTPIAGSPFACGNTPSQIAYTVDSAFIYAANSNSAASVYGFGTVATPTYNLVNMVFDPTGGTGGVMYLNGRLNINGSFSLNGGTPATYPAFTGNGGRFLRVNAAETGVVWDFANNLIPAAMAANAASITVPDSADNIVEITGALTAQGALTATFATPGDPTKVVFDNATTGGFPVVLNGTYTIPPGKSYWYWNTSTLEFVTAQYQTDGGVVGTFKNLKIDSLGVNNYNCVITADEVVLENGSNQYLTVRAVNKTINANGTVGAPLSIMSARAASTWYYRWLWYNATNGLTATLDTSSTAPTAPTGYASTDYKALLPGACRTDASGSTYLVQTSTRGRRSQYVVLAGSNTASIPSMASGTTTGTVAVSTSSFVPLTASRISIQLSGIYNGNGAGAGPNSNGLVSSGNTAFPIVLTASGTITLGGFADFELESTNIYWNASGSSYLNCLGWEDN